MTFFSGIILAMFLAVGAVAFRWGGAPERAVAVVLVGWNTADFFYHLIQGPSAFVWVDNWHLLLDGAMLATTMWVALRANRMWPLWVAAAAVISFSGHLAVLVRPEGNARAYWALTQLPQYVQLVALMLGTYAHAMRLQRLGGPYRSWRKNNTAEARVVAMQRA